MTGNVHLTVAGSRYSQDANEVAIDAEHVVTLVNERRTRSKLSFW